MVKAEPYVIETTKMVVERAKRIAKKLYEVNAKFNWKYLGIDWFIRQPKIYIYGNGTFLMEMCITKAGVLGITYSIGGMNRSNSILQKRAKSIFAESNIPSFLAHIYVLNTYLLPRLSGDSNFYIRRSEPTHDYVEIEIGHASNSSFRLLVYIPAGSDRRISLSLQSNGKTYSVSPKGKRIFTLGEQLKQYLLALEI